MLTRLYHDLLVIFHKYWHHSFKKCAPPQKKKKKLLAPLRLNVLHSVSSGDDDDLYLGYCSQNMEVAFRHLVLPSLLSPTLQERRVHSFIWEPSSPPPSSIRHFCLFDVLLMARAISIFFGGGRTSTLAVLSAER